ncbi:efflux RND transporter periplasmic adaptor subunit [Jannaschia pohangensis]|uniref:Membrane fusion protein, multidrug efflux system n=1 Tax=Jannaschia pohangensis TaxID=390807 RepID=A0A1I3I9R7_9RHOB|nr:efflux RND transporter periplasmic adaptor subunit [Jannaschia pohangensis]SFI44728.1 membrane fusion protein, multidrug efflux system [Jannaschia pohangensis]
MRFFPVLTAVFVCVALFFVVLQRDALFNKAAELTGTEVEATDDAPPAAETGPVAIATTETASAERVHVVALRSEAQDVADAVMVRGQSEAFRQVSLLPEVSGTVISTPIRKGAFVESGQVLCELNPGTSAAVLAEAQARLSEARARVPEARARVPEAQARVAEAEARLEEARINQNAAARLSEGGFASETRVANADASLRSAEAGVTAATTGLETVQAGIESAQAGVEAAEAGVLRAQLDIEKLTIEAPFAGLLETDTAELGTFLQAGGPSGEGCATVVQLDPIKLVGFLPEAQVDRVEVGAVAGARLASGQEVTGEVTFLSRAADDLTRTFRVEVTVPNADLAIRDGQTAEILIGTDPTTAHMVPASALTLDDEGRLGVRTVENGRAGFMPVTLVRDTQEGVLLSGLPDSVEIITVGQEYVTDGVPVRATYEAELNQ